MAETYKPITKDDEVESIEDVQVSRTRSEEISDILTLRYLNTRIAVLTTEIASTEAEKARFLELKERVTIEAEKVQLKEPEVEEPEVIE